jgi:hypothetical protein
MEISPDVNYENLNIYLQILSKDISFIMTLLVKPIYSKNAINYDNNPKTIFPTSIHVEKIITNHLQINSCH